MNYPFTTLPSDLPKYKRHISFFENKSTQVCTGINLEATCSNPNCQSVRELGGLVIVKFPGVRSCVYQEVVPHLRCPSCGGELQSDRVKGVVFVRCEARIDIGAESVVFRARGEETVLWELPYQGSEVRIALLDIDRDPEPKPESKEFMNPDDGVNLSGVCRNRECQASKASNGFVIIKLGRIESQTYQELLYHRSCPSCHHPLEPDCFREIIFCRCQGEVEFAGNVQKFDAHQTPKRYKIDLSESTVIVSIRQSIADILHSTAGKDTQEAVRSNQGNPSTSPNKDQRSDHRTEAQHRGGDMPYISTCQGINFEAHCPNGKCSAYKENNGFVYIKSGHMLSCDYRAAIQTLACPSCSRSIPPTCIRGVALVRCRGEIQIGEEKQIFQTKGDEIHKISIPHDGTQVKIEITYTEESYQSPHTEPGPGDKTYTKECDGVNFIAFCQNPNCAAFREYNGYVNVKRDKQFIERNGFPATRCHYSREIHRLICPSCGNPLNADFVEGVALVRCKGTFVSSEESEQFAAERNVIVRHSFDKSDASAIIEYAMDVFEPRNEEGIDFRPDSSVSDVRAHVMEMEAETCLPFPESQREGSVSKGGGFSYHSVSHGLNFLVSCSNPACAAVRNRDSVIIKAGHIIDRDIRLDMESLNCSSCEAKIRPNQDMVVTFLCCSGEITIGGKKEIFTPTGNAASEFEIPCDNSPVMLKIHNREYHIKHNFPEFLKKTYTKHHNGVNFHCYCKNPLCKAVKDTHGLVIVQRDDRMVRRNGYSPFTCNYSHEISQLDCPSCGSRLKKYYVWGVGLLHCRGVITRNGSPVESFSPNVELVVQYELDSGDTSLKIEFEVSSSPVSVENYLD